MQRNRFGRCISVATAPIYDPSFYDETTQNEDMFESDPVFVPTRGSASASSAPVSAPAPAPAGWDLSADSSSSDASSDQDSFSEGEDVNFKAIAEESTKIETVVPEIRRPWTSDAATKVTAGSENAPAEFSSDDFESSDASDYENDESTLNDLRFKAIDQDVNAGQADVDLQGMATGEPAIASEYEPLDDSTDESAIADADAVEDAELAKMLEGMDPDEVAALQGDAEGVDFESGDFENGDLEDAEIDALVAKYGNDMAAPGSLGAFMKEAGDIAAKAEGNRITPAGLEAETNTSASNVSSETTTASPMGTAPVVASLSVIAVLVVLAVGMYVHHKKRRTAQAYASAPSTDLPTSPMNKISIDADSPDALIQVNQILDINHPYISQRHDELSVNIGDKVRVRQVFTDRWALGELLDSGRVGVFPLVTCD